MFDGKLVEWRIFNVCSSFSSWFVGLFIVCLCKRILFIISFNWRPLSIYNCPIHACLLLVGHSNVQTVDFDVSTITYTLLCILFGQMHSIKIKCIIRTFKIQIWQNIFWKFSGPLKRIQIENQWFYWQIFQFIERIVNWLFQKSFSIQSNCFLAILNFIVWSRCV